MATINGINGDIRRHVINEAETRDDEELFGHDYPRTGGLVVLSRAACGWVMFLCLPAFFYQPLVLLMRFLNFGVINSNIAIFLAMVRL